jgi:shikimate dehydrogenase
VRERWSWKTAEQVLRLRPRWRKLVSPHSDSLSHYPKREIRQFTSKPEGYDIIVNATPIGSHRGDPLPIDVNGISKWAFVGEVVMTQELTPLLAAAAERGCETHSGTDLLFEQIPAYLEFFGLPATTPDELRAVAKIAY